MENTMLKDFVEKIQEMALEGQPRLMEIDGETYATGKLYKIDKPFYTPAHIGVNTLSSMVNLLKAEIDKTYKPLFVRIKGPTDIDVFSAFHDDREYQRDVLYSASAELPEVYFSQFVEHENFMIALRSKFIETEDVLYLLDLLSKISDKESVSSEDNGLSQTVQAKKGIALVKNVAVKPKVVLQPFRTFIEVEQPASEFLVRLREGGHIALFEADGGAWKLEAKRNIKKYLDEAFADDIAKGNVIIIA